MAISIWKLRKLPTVEEPRQNQAEHLGFEPWQGALRFSRSGDWGNEVGHKILAAVVLPDAG